MLLEACSSWFAYEVVLKALQTTDHRKMPLKKLLAMDTPSQVCTKTLASSLSACLVLTASARQLVLCLATVSSLHMIMPEGQGLIIVNECWHVVAVG